MFTHIACAYGERSYQLEKLNHMLYDVRRARPSGGAKKKIVQVNIWLKKSVGIGLTTQVI